MTQMTMHGSPLPSLAWLPAKRRKSFGDDNMARIEDAMLESGFWNAADLNAEQTGEIVSEFEVTSTDYGNRMQGKLKIGSNTKAITFNNTSTKNVAKAYGKDSKKWIGKKVTVKKLKQMVSGKEKEIIYIFTK